MAIPTALSERVAPGGLRLAAVPALAALPLLVLVPLAGLALLMLSAGIVWFHRDPDRDPPASGIVAPADGSVSVVREEAVGEEGEGSRLRVGVFMNVTDVHVNRAPAPGTVRTVDHRPGANRPAFSKDSDRNERVVVDCGDYQYAQIAGWFARRIHPYVEAGDEVARGQRVGHVSFGSRADVLLPPAVDREDLRVAEADDVRAGETVLAPEPDAER